MQKIRIGVLLNTMYSEYSSCVIDGIEKYCKEHGCVQIIYPLLRGITPTNYDFQFNSISAFIDSNNIDVLVVSTPTIANGGNLDLVCEEIKALPEMVKVSLGWDIPGLPSVVVSPTKAIIESVKHLYKNHGRRKFLLVRANSSFFESNEREAAFRQGLKECGLELKEENVLNGNFIFEHAYEALSKRIKSSKKLDFDAVFCVNDNMALACIACLEDNGICVPRDVSLIGFDNIDNSREDRFNFSTIDQRIGEQSYEAAKIACRLFEQKKKSAIRKCINAVPIFRASCGCNNQEAVRKNLLMHSDKKIYSKKINSRSSYQLYLLHVFLVETQDPVPLEGLYNRLAYCFSLFDIENAMLVLYDRPVHYVKGELFQYPESAVLKMIYVAGLGIDVKDAKFNPHISMIPIEFENNYTLSHVVFPVFAENYQYGYFIFKLGQYENLFYQSMFELITKEIVASLKLSEAQSDKINLESQNVSLSAYSEQLHTLSLTDELTGLLNRRGFYEAAEHTIQSYTSFAKHGLVIYGDMDGLKRINDTFGHEAGDRAIRKEAELLKQLFRSSDIVGRLGGDEFAIIAPDMSIEDFARVKKSLNDKCAEYNAKEIEPFILSISIGCSEFSEKQISLDALLNEADMKLYEEKRIKKQNGIVRSST